MSFPNHFIQEPCKNRLCLPCGVGVDIHGGTDTITAAKAAYADYQDKLTNGKKDTAKRTEAGRKHI